MDRKRSRCVIIKGAEISLPSSFSKSSNTTPRNLHTHPCYELVCIRTDAKMIFTVIPPMCEHMSADAPPEKVSSMLFKLTSCKDDILSVLSELKDVVEIADTFGGEECINSVKETMECPRKGSDELITAELRLLFVKLCRELCYDNSDISEKKQTLDSERLSILDDYFNVNLNNPNCNKKELADMLGVTERHLSRILLIHYNSNFSALLLQSRMSMAMALLLQGEKNIEAIAAKVGYSSARTFKQAYFNYFGESPITR